MKEININELLRNFKNPYFSKVVSPLENIYRHVDGGLYQIVNIIKHKTEDGEWMPSVLYTHINGGTEMFSRDIETFHKRFEAVESKNLLKFDISFFSNGTYKHKDVEGCIYSVKTPDGKKFDNLPLIQNELTNSEDPHLMLFTNDEELVKWNESQSKDFTFTIDVNIRGNKEGKLSVGNLGFDLEITLA